MQSPVTLTIRLSRDHAEYVQVLVQSGDYGSADDVLAAALRCLRSRVASLRTGALSQVEDDASVPDSVGAREAMQQLLALRDGTTLGPGVSWQDLRDEGRR